MKKNSRMRISAEHGFTLMEVMVAMAIIAIALTAIFHMHSQTVVMANSSQFYTMAPFLADRKMAELTAGFEDRGEGNGDFGETFPGYTWRFSKESIESETLGTLARDVQKIEVTVIAGEDGETFTLRRYQFAPEGE